MFTNSVLVIRRLQSYVVPKVEKKNIAAPEAYRAKINEPGSLLSSQSTSNKQMSGQSNRSTEDLIRKSLHAGHVYQLTHAKKESESSLRNWFENFLSLFEVEEQTVIQKVQYLWRKNDILEANSLLLYPSKREQLAKLFNNNRLARDMFNPPLTDAEVTILTDTDGEELNYASKANSTTNVCPTCRNDCVGTCVGHRHVFDRVMRHITNGLFNTAPAAFAEASTVRKALAKFQNTAKRFILPELADAFNNGKYINWKSLTNSVRRAFNVKEERKTLANLFSRIHTTATSTINMENKIDSLAGIAMEIAITDKKDFFRPKDFDGDLSQTMSTPEQYGPMVNTLLTYIVMRETVPITKWETVQTDFERKIQSGWSYRSWHENRPQLYEIVDRSRTDVKRIGAVGINQTNVNTNEADDAEPSNDGESNIGPECIHDYPTSPEYGEQNRRHFESNRNESNEIQPSMTQYDRRMANHQAPRKRTCLCLHCSHLHPHRLTVYHPEGSGFGGNGKYCLFDAEGRERNDAKGRTIQAIGYEFEFIDADGAYPIMADVEMFDQPTEADMTSSWRTDKLHDRKTQLARASTKNILSVREGKVCTAAPNIKANFGTNGVANRYGTINFDSGAMVSYIHESMITHSDFVKSGPRIGEFYGAGGDHLKLKPFVIDIKVNVGDKGVYVFKNVLVAISNTPSSTMLVGQSDLERLGIDISFARRTVTFGKGALKGVPLPMERKEICSIDTITETRRKEPIQHGHYCSSKKKSDDINTDGFEDCKVGDCCVDLGKRQTNGKLSACLSKLSDDSNSAVGTTKLLEKTSHKEDMMDPNDLEHLNAAEAPTERGSDDDEIIYLNSSDPSKRRNQEQNVELPFEKRKLSRTTKAKPKVTPTELKMAENSGFKSDFNDNQLKMKIEVGDTVQLKVGVEEKDIPTAWLVRIIDSTRKRLLLKRISGLDTGRRERRWAKFDLVEKVLPTMDQIYQLYLDHKMTSSEVKLLPHSNTRVASKPSTQKKDRLKREKLSSVTERQTISSRRQVKRRIRVKPKN